jgi:hypothetical protein
LSEQDDAGVINDAISDPVPAMPEQGSNEVTLLRGVYEKSGDVGTWHDVAEVRELTGEDEERLARLSKKKDILYSEYMTEILKLAVVKVGNVKVRDKPAVIDSLIFADRDILYLGIIKATYGREKVLNYTCSSCQTANDLYIDLVDDFPIKKPDFDIRKGVEVETSKGVRTVRLPAGSDVSTIQKKTETDAELNTHMLAKCVVWPEGETPADPVAWARSLNVADRRKLINAVLDVEVGPKLGEVDTQCAACGEQTPLALDWVSLLLS